MGGNILSDPNSQPDEKLLSLLKKQGYELKYRFDHPLFGALILGLYKLAGREPKNVYVRELKVKSEESGLQIYQYLLRQEEQESPSFPRIFCHLIKPIEVLAHNADSLRQRVRCQGDHRGVRRQPEEHDTTEDRPVHVHRRRHAGQSCQHGGQSRLESPVSHRNER